MAMHTLAVAVESYLGHTNVWCMYVLNANLFRHVYLSIVVIPNEER